MSKSKTLSFVSSKGIKLHADLYTATANRLDTTIIYFHGGGLLYGVRDDLPEQYIEMFLAAGYDLLTLDYPLAPECLLPEILDTAYEELSYYLDNTQQILELPNTKYILFGRSAGAYLVFNMCTRLIGNAYTKPEKLICMYGYSEFEHPQFLTPNKHYGKMAQISDEQACKIVQEKPVVYGPLAERFALYIKARQDASWLEYLGIEADPKAYSIDMEMLQQFPPTVMAAATLDQDVPYKSSKQLSRTIPNSKLITVYKEEHDFDRDVNDPTGRKVYQEIIEWLNA